MKFRPLHDRVVVKRIDAEEKSAGGIIIPDTAKEKPSQGEVIAVGPGGRDEAGKLIPIDVIGRRPRAVRQVVRDRSQDRRPGAPHHEGVRHYGAGGQEEGRVTNTQLHSSFFAARGLRRSRRMTTTDTGETSHGCQGSQIFG
jgi:hypothetical protein